MPPSLCAARSRLRAFDARADGALDHLRGRRGADRLFYAASEVGDFSLLWLIFGALRALRSDRDTYAALRMAAGLAAESFVVNAVIKSIFRRHRPPWDVERPLRVRRPRTSSFPSGHATSAFTAAVLLAEDDPLWPLYYLAAAIVATSRAYVKIHHGSDVAAGIVVGVALGMAGRRISPLPGPVPLSEGGSGPGPAA